jgi:threonine/homoserine/homoserine lactone efflux protein
LSIVTVTGGCSIVAVVVVAAAGGAAILDVATIIIARVKIVGVAVLTQLLFLLLRWIIPMPSTKSMDKRLPLGEDQRTR